MPTLRSLEPIESQTFQYRKPIRGSLIWWLRFCGVVAFVAILLIQLPRSQQVRLDRIDLRWLGLCMALTVCQLLLDSLIWQWLLSAQRIRHPYAKTLPAYLASQYLGLVTPGHVGEFLAAGYVTMETGITFGYALSSVVMKKLLFWLTIAAFGVWGLPLLAETPFRLGVRDIVWLSATVVIAMSIGITLWVFSLRRLAKKWGKLSPWQIDMTEFWAGIRHLLSPRLLAPLALAVLTFCVLFLQLDAVLRSMGLEDVPFVRVCQIMGLSRVAARLIPISVVGFGSKDAAVIWLLTQQGVEFSAALAATLLLLVCSYLVTLLLSGLCWWIKPLVIRRAAPSSS